MRQPAADLPPGQREIDNFPRFGLHKYARRFKSLFEPLELRITGQQGDLITVTTGQLNSLPRVEQKSDFHCVTTWSKRALHWGGYRFSEFYQAIVRPQLSQESGFMIFRSQDGFRAILPLADLLGDDVLLADCLGGKPLTSKHGAPLRLIMPAHYGYKSVKHLKAIEFCRHERDFRPPAFRFMGHLRGRVAQEERGQGVPGWLLRYLYRPLIKPTIRLFERSMR